MNFRTLVNLMRRTNPSVSVIKPVDVAVSSIVLDSREVVPGAIFAALQGEETNGAAFVPEAVRNGAVALLSSRRLPTELPQIISANPRETLAHLCAAFYGRPSLDLGVAGVTGTNGKTTSAYLLRHIIESAGKGCGMLGTIECVVGERTIDAGMTTPEAPQLQRWLAEMARDGQEACVMEVSSHALSQHRADATEVDVALFTNLTQDHLDYHDSMEEYFETKARLFEKLSPQKFAVINIDDIWGERLFSKTRANIIRYGFSSWADISANNLQMNTEGMSFRLAVKGFGEVEIQTPLVGRHNVYNILGCVASALALGIDFRSVFDALKTFNGAPGRLERVSTSDLQVGPQPSVFVDYAHTPDALENVLKTLREVCKGRKLVSLFGCGGNRDASKRPLMGAIAERLSDHIVVTSDNPRNEDPMAIIKDIKDGLRGGPMPTSHSVRLTPCEIEPDRASAIRLALEAAGDDGVVLVAGKGHENYQIFGDERRDFDDCAEVRLALSERGQMTHA